MIDKLIAAAGVRHRRPQAYVELGAVAVGATGPLQNVKVTLIVIAGRLDFTTEL